MKLNRIALALSAFLWINNASATGFYAGGSLGIKSVNSHANLTLGPISTTVGIPLTASLNSEIDMGSQGGTGTLFAGYRFDFRNCYFLSLEANAEFNSILNESTSTLVLDPLLTLSVYNALVSVKQSYGLSLLPGYRISKRFTFYGRFGFSVGRIQTILTTPFRTMNKYFNKFGGQVGFGSEYAISKRLKLRTEYIYAVYPTVTSSSTASLAGILNVPMRAKFLLRTNTFNWGLNYYFA